jgi:esterase/lipase superfamily enzyme
LTSYTTTTESGEYAIRHLKKTIRLLSTTPGVERVQLPAHSRGAALLLSAAGALFTEAIAAGFEPSEVFNLGHMLLFSPDVDVDVLRQHVAGNLSDPSMLSRWPRERMPRALHGQLTVYTSPKDRALLISRILFRSRSRAGELEVEDISLGSQRKLEPLDKIAFIVYQGKPTDTFGHSYFTTNPRVSSDIVRLLRYGEVLGKSAREPVKVGPVVWEFPRIAK